MHTLLPMVPAVTLSRVSRRMMESVTPLTTKGGDTPSESLPILIAELANYCVEVPAASRMRVCAVTGSGRAMILVQ